MKKFLLVWLVLLATLALFAQDGKRAIDENNASIRSIVLDDSTKEMDVELSSSDIAVIKLPANPSTGYRWEVENLDKIEGTITMIEERDGSCKAIPEFEETSANAIPMPCAPKIQKISFVGKQAGAVNMKLVYRRPWLAGYADVKRVYVRSHGAYSGNIEALKPAVKRTQATRPPLEEVTAPGLPARFDWRDTNQVTAVRDQGQCGSCWAFGATAAVEAKILIKDGVARDYSEQYIVSCNMNGFGCGGGWWSYDYYYNKCLPTEAGAGGRLESDFPYQASDVPCNPPHTPHEQLEGWAYCDDVADGAVPSVTHNITTAMVKQKIYDYGPVGTCVDCSNWGSYTGGVWSETGGTTNHIVLITGWDDAQGCFFIKNSWGATWGENGYIRLAYGSDSVGEYATYVLYETTTPKIVYRSSTFYEGKNNDGTIGNTVDVYIAHSTSSTQFSKTSGYFTQGTHYTVANLPSGLTLQIQALSATTAKVSITGAVSAHASANSISNLTINFLGAAFSGGNASVVGNASYNQLKINFNDPYQLIYYDAPDTTCDYINTWQFFWLEGSNYMHSFGLWYYGYNSVYPEDPENYTLKLETYTAPALSTGTTLPGRLIPLSAGASIGPNSQYWCNGGTYGDQHTITGPYYTSWNGRTAYVGFQFLYQGYTVYGWMRLQVDSSGSAVTLLDYAWDQDPRNVILAGQKTYTGTAPSITAQPVNQSVSVGATATFSVGASGTSPLSYQWYKNGATISGATASSYTTPATTSADNGATFYVRVSNSYGSVNSNTVTLTVTSTTAPTITTQPVSRTVAAGATATFSVVATGSTPLSYQWYKNGATISGATSASYTTPATTSADNGATFYVRVSNSVGSVNSNTVTLTVTSSGVPTITTQPVNRTVAAGATATFSVVATNATSYQWYKNGAAISGATSASYTTPATTSADNGATFYVRVSNSVGSVNSNTVTLTVTSSTTFITVTSPNGGEQWQRGTTQTISWSSSGVTNVKIDLLKSGVLNKTIVSSTAASTGSYSWAISSTQGTGTAYSVRITSTTSSTVKDVSDAYFSITSTSAASITVTSPNGGEQWQRGTTQTVRWTASGVTNVKIELLKAGALNRTITSSTAASTGSYNWAILSTQEVRSDYTVRITSTTSSTVKDVSNAYFSITSSSGTAPSITTQPVSQTVSAGQTATFSVAATGATPLSYQWYKNGATISGATSSSYTTPATTSSDNGATFYVVVSNSYGNVTSNTVTLTVSSTPGTLAVVSPNGGEQWARGSTQTIRWTAPSTTSHIDIALYNGTTFVQWITYYQSASTGSYSWTIPTSLTAASTYKVMILDYYTRTLTDYSNAAFQLY